MRNSIILVLLFLPISIFSNSNNTITIEGNNSGWATDEAFTDCSSADNVFFTWDADYLYFGISDADADFGNLATFVYFDTDPTGTNGSTNAYAWGNYITTAFKADYVVVWKNKSGEDYIEVRQYDNLTGIWGQIVNNTSSNYNSGEIEFAIGTNYREIKIKRNILGSPNAIKTSMFSEQQWNSYYRYFVWPSEDWVDGNRAPAQSLGHYKGYFLEYGVSPTTSRYHDATFINFDFGASTTAWADAVNWTGDVEPSVDDLITIPAGFSVVVGEVGEEAGDIWLESGASLVIDPLKDLTVKGPFISENVNTGVTIRSTAAGNGSLIYSGYWYTPVTVERYMTGYSGNDDGWHFLSSPVFEPLIAGTDFAPGDNDDFFAYDEASDLWLNQKKAENNILQFERFTGYLVAFETEEIKKFYGTLNIVGVTLENLSKGSGDGWHLLGNPYPSAILWNSTGMQLTHIGGVAKIWNDNIDNYTDLEANNIIPSTNGFLVQASESTNEIRVSDNAMTANTSVNYKLKTENKLRIVVSNNMNPYQDANIIGFRSDATLGFDWEFDSHKFFGGEQSPQLFSKSENELYSINYLPILKSEYHLDLNFIAGVDAFYTMKFEGLNSFAQTTKIVLEDKLTQEFVDMDIYPEYTFNASVNEQEERFVLHFNSVSAVESLNEKPNYKIYSHHQTLYVINESNENSYMQIFDLAGKEVLRINNMNDKESSYQLNQAEGFYLVKIKGGKHQYTDKILLTK